MKKIFLKAKLKPATAKPGRENAAEFAKASVESAFAQPSAGETVCVIKIVKAGKIQ